MRKQGYSLFAVFLLFFALGINSFRFLLSLGALPAFYELIISQTNDIDIIAFGIFFAFAIMLAAFDSEEMRNDVKITLILKKSLQTAFATIVIFVFANMLAYCLLTGSFRFFHAEPTVLSAFYEKTSGAAWGSILLIFVRMTFMACFFFHLRNYWGENLVFLILILLNYFDRYFIIVESTTNPPLICMGTYSLYDYVFTSYFDILPNYCKYVVFWLCAFGIIWALGAVARKMKLCKKSI